MYVGAMNAQEILYAHCKSIFDRKSNNFFFMLNVLNSNGWRVVKRMGALHVAHIPITFPFVSF